MDAPPAAVDSARPPVGGRDRRLRPPWLSEVVFVHDVLFGLLIVGMFGVLALCAKGVEKL